MKTIITVLFCAVFTYTAASQSSFGYLGKRIYLKGDVSASPSIFSRNVEGNMLTLKFNFLSTISANMVLNKKHVLALNYKQYSSVAYINAEGTGIFFSRFLNSYSGSDDEILIGDYRFTTNEIGFNYQFFTNDLDAPLGTYLSIGFGMAYSKYNVPFQILSEKYYSSNIQQIVLSFDNSTIIRSPILRFGIGKQTVFWNRFLFDYGIDFGLNLGHIGAQIATVAGYVTDLSTSQDLNQEQLDFVSKKAVQNRVFMMNLINFRLGLACLLF